MIIVIPFFQISQMRPCTNCNVSKTRQPDSKKKKTEHVTPMLVKLHWLPVKDRIFYKIALLCHKCINNRAPSYLQDLIHLYVPSRSLRFSDQLYLSIPKRGSKKLGDRCFHHFAPTVWNSLPENLRKITSEASFKVNQKT